MMEENLFVNVVSCKACSFTVFCQKKCHKKKKDKESDTWMDLYLRSRSCQFFIQKFHVLDYTDSTQAYKPVECRYHKQFFWSI